jgi:hypothetical protein
MAARGSKARKKAKRRRHAKTRKLAAGLMAENMADRPQRGSR